ncbi:MAG: hypothetical protein WB699_11470 [Bacteroidota bacterium]
MQSTFWSKHSRFLALTTPTFPHVIGTYLESACHVRSPDGKPQAPVFRIRRRMYRGLIRNDDEDAGVAVAAGRAHGASRIAVYDIYGHVTLG